MTKSEETTIALMQNDIKNLVKSQESGHRAIMEEIRDLKESVKDYPVIKSRVEAHQSIFMAIGGTVFLAVLGAVISLVIIQ